MSPAHRPAASHPRCVLPALLLCLGLSSSVFAAEALPVGTKPVSALVIFPEWRAPATVVSLNTSRISAEISARVTALPVRVGQTVEPGQVLARLDDRDYRLALDQAQAAARALEARIALARYELERARSLSAKQAVSEQLLKQREAELNTLLAERQGQEVAIALARRNLDKTVLSAPYRALVTARLASLGELAAPGTALLEILDAAQLEVSSQVQTELTESLKNASDLQLAVGKIRYPLTLRVLTPAVDSRMRTREARLLFSADQALPGSAGELVWRNHQPYLPADVLVRRGGKIGVFVAQDDKAVFQALPSEEEGRPVPSTLAPTAQIILQGRFNLQDGDRIRRVE